MSETSTSDVEREDLVSFLREQRDEFHEIHSDSDYQTGRAYAHGRYHAYCDVLAWMFARVDRRETVADTERGGDDE